MNNKLYTDEELDELQSMPKRVTNPRARWTNKPAARPVHRQVGYQVAGRKDETIRFSVYLRQNIAVESDFSCGISYLPHGGPSLTLARYNGSSHQHGDIFYRPHIHRASERAIASGKKPESEAKETDRFNTLEGALACLVEDFNLSGISTQHDEPRLFHDT